jgi:Cu2+-exporting ATPase
MQGSGPRPDPTIAAGTLHAWGVLLTPAIGAVFMSASTVIVAINARLLRLKK